MVADGPEVSGLSAKMSDDGSIIFYGGFGDRTYAVNSDGTGTREIPEVRAYPVAVSGNGNVVFGRIGDSGILRINQAARTVPAVSANDMLLIGQALTSQGCNIAP